MTKLEKGDPFLVMARMPVLVRKEGFIFKKDRSYKISGKGINIQEDDSVKELISNSAFGYELMDSETLRGAFALNPPSMKVWIYFMVGLLIGALILSKIVYGVVVL